MKQHTKAGLAGDALLYLCLLTIVCIPIIGMYA